VRFDNGRPGGGWCTVWYVACSGKIVIVVDGLGGIKYPLFVDQRNLHFEARGNGAGMPSWARDEATIRKSKKTGTIPRDFQNRLLHHKPARV
jgi:hypothetical protein